MAQVILEAKSNAKINLFLHVISRKNNGFHILESLFAPIGLHDVIEIEDSDELEIVSDIEDNIALKAAQLLREKFEVTKGAHIKITKNIPLGAGLGGGCSNDTDTIKLLNKLWGLNLSVGEQISIASQIGADVPFFIINEPAFVSGIGEIIKPVKLGLELPILLVYPNQHVSTKEVFAKGFTELSTSIPIEAVARNIIEGKNDLTANAIKICPEIDELLTQLSAAEGIRFCRMSGSGSTCFGVFDSTEHLTKAEEYFKNMGHWTYSERLKI